MAGGSAQRSQDGEATTGSARLSHMVTDGMASARRNRAMDGMASARLSHITMGNARLSHMVTEDGMASARPSLAMDGMESVRPSHMATEDGMASAKLSLILVGALTQGHQGHWMTERRLFCIAIEGDDVDIPKKCVR